MVTMTSSYRMTGDGRANTRVDTLDTKILPRYVMAAGIGHEDRDRHQLVGHLLLVPCQEVVD
jgi:hypothetical protein